jgi:hypothetical protein
MDEETQEPAIRVPDTNRKATLRFFHLSSVYSNFFKLFTFCCS